MKGSEKSRQSLLDVFMLFNSVNFLIFFPIVFLIYFVLPGKIKWVWLLVTSYFFYMCWSVKYTFLLLFTTVSTYIIALILGKAQKLEGKKKDIVKKASVVAGIIINLGILAIFKYGNFVIDNINQVTGNEFKALDLVLPVGISFYTFQAIGYVIDVFRGGTKPERNLGKYALFLSFFPQLVAGPIERSNNLLSQLYQEHKFDYERARSGILLITWGLFQKIVIADRAAILVNAVFKNYEDYMGAQLMFAAVCFAIQIYCDFGGYSNIAIGASEMLGIKLMDNFRHPYLAVSIKDFWSRWHISLSTWFRDYLYIPLGGNRCSKGRKHLNVMCTMLLSGLWHGANWTYIFWGWMHGAYQVIGDITYKARNKLKEFLKIKTDTTIYKVFQGICTFALVDLAWIFFRAESIEIAVSYICRMFLTFDIRDFLNESLFNIGLDMREVYLLIFLMLFLFVVSLIQKRMSIRRWLTNQNIIFRWMVYLVSVFLILLWGIYGEDYQQTQFIYFQF